MLPQGQLIKVANSFVSPASGYAKPKKWVKSISRWLGCHTILPSPPKGSNVLEGVLFICPLVMAWIYSLGASTLRRFRVNACLPFLQRKDDIPGAEFGTQCCPNWSRYDPRKLVPIPLSQDLYDIRTIEWRESGCVFRSEFERLTGNMKTNSDLFLVSKAIITTCN